ncbi:DUF262 domain-containing protein [Flavobacterium chungangensis]|uniref:DUF262 domain-containing protein n=1 Tax=Flavobacterium chungangensis TaxID=2708132 RepID=A0ABV8Z9C2_9FLAO
MNFTRPELLSLYDLLTNRLFQIPDYQRTYSWRKKQRRDLFNDIIKIREKDKEHFMATLVCLSKNKRQIGGSRFDVLDIVDGQQRITSLIILLKSLCFMLESGNKEEKDIADDLKKLLVKEKDETIILLQTNHDTSNVFSEYLRNNSKPSISDLSIEAERNLSDAFSESEIFVKSWGEKWGLSSLYQIIMDKLKFILHIIEDEGIVYTVFEVLNSRGLDVDWLDKCKSLLLGIVYEVTEDKSTINSTMIELHTIWSNIYRTIGLNEIHGDEIIRFAATLLNQNNLSKSLSAQESLDFIRTYCGDKPRKVVYVSNWLLKVSKELLIIRQNPFLDAVTKISHVRLLKLAIELREDFSEDEKKELRIIWEKVSFRIFGIAGKDSRSKVGEYVKLSQNIFRKQQIINEQKIAFPKDDIKRAIKNLGSEFEISEIIREIKDKDLYEANNWKDELRYFFYKYETYLNAKKGYNFPEIVWIHIWKSSLNQTIEHIYPQSPSSNWQKLPPNNIHRLGNLTIVTPEINSEAYNKSFINKKVAYRKENRLLSLQKIVEEYDEWDIKNIERREEELINWAIAEWG